MELNYKIIYSNRKTIGITVERDRSVVVRAPLGSDPQKIQNLIERKKFWIFQKQNHVQKYNSSELRKEFVNGESVLYLGRNYRLQIIKSDQDNIKLVGKFIINHSSGSAIQNVFKNWFIDKANEKITPRIKYYARNMGVKYHRIMIMDMKYRWGSCTPNNNLCFNWRLIKAPMSVIDYIIVHELAHFLEPNHSTKFWNIVSIQNPNFEKAKDWLKRHGEVLEYDF